MAKNNKKALLIGAGALAALYFWNKHKQSVEEFTPPVKSAVKPQAVNTPVVTMAQATPKMFNPVNNTLNSLTSIKPKIPFLSKPKTRVVLNRRKEAAVNGGLPIL